MSFEIFTVKFKHSLKTHKTDKTLTLFHKKQFINNFTNLKKKSEILCFKQLVDRTNSM